MKEKVYVLIKHNVLPNLPSYLCIVEKDSQLVYWDSDMTVVTQRVSRGGGGG